MSVYLKLDFFRFECFLGAKNMQNSRIIANGRFLGYLLEKLSVAKNYFTLYLFDLSVSKTTFTFEDFESSSWTNGSRLIKALPNHRHESKSSMRKVV